MKRTLAQEWRRYGLAFLLISIPALGLLAYHLSNEFDSKRESAATQAHNLTHVIESRVEAVLRQAEALVTFLAETADPETLNSTASTKFEAVVDKKLNLALRNFPEAVGVRYFDANGDLLYSVPRIQPISIAGREYFRAIKGETSIDTRFSDVLISRLSGDAIFVVARAIRAKDAALLGVVTVTLDVSTIGDLFKTLEIGRNGAVAMRRMDNNAVVVRVPELMGVDYPPQPTSPLRDAILAGSQSGTQEIVSTADGVKRTYGYAKVGKYPFYVVLGLAERDYLAEWYDDTRNFALLALVFEVAILAVLVRLAKNARRLSLAERTADDERIRLQTILRTASDGIHLVDSEGKLVEANRAFLDMLGLDESAIGHVSVPDWDVSDDWPGIKERLASLLATDEHRVFETRHRCHDGRIIDVEVNCCGITLGGQRLFCASSRDVTERKNLDRALRESMESFRAVFRSSPVGICIAAVEGGHFLDANDAWLKMMGYTRDEVIGRTGVELDIWVDPASRTRMYELLRTGGEVRNSEAQFRGKSGECVETISSACLVPFEGRACIVGSFTDITENKRNADELERHRHHLEELVRERTAELDNLYNNAPCGYHSVDSDGRYIAINDTELKMLGYTRDEVVGKLSMRDIYVPDEIPLFETRFAEFKRVGQVKDLEFRARCKDGTIVPVLLNAKVIRDESGTFLYSNSTMTDNRERKAREQQIAALNEELARRARQAESANLAKSTFLANMSHEIRTPMNAILGMAHLMQRSGPTPQQSQQLAKIDSAAKHLLGIISDILDLSKIEAEKMTLEEAPVAVGKLGTDVMSMLSERTLAKNLRVVVECDSIPDNLLGDSTRLTQALLNFANNAVKFTEKGSIAVRTRLVEETTDSVLIRFEVQDTGIGLADESAARLFNAFEQADNSTTRRFGGTGLGLAISQRLAQMMGGAAGVESQLGAGSLFWFTARLRKGPDSARAEERKLGPGQAEQILRRHHAGTRVLVVEDEPINQEIAVLTLQDAGMVVDVADDGAQAVNMVSRSHYAVILMDMQMPKMDGLEATRRIRCLRNGADVPIVAMTANAFAEDRERCIAAGMNDFIGKPAEPEALFRILLGLLEARVPA